jgi:ankyrin repeat protein
MEELTNSLTRISFSPSYDGVADPMSQLVKEMSAKLYSEEAAIERISNSQNTRALLRYHSGRCFKLIHFAAACGYDDLLSFIVSQIIVEPGYSMTDYINSLDEKMLTPLRLAKQNRHESTAALLIQYGAVERFSDLSLRCRKCKKSFVFQSRQQEYNASNGVAAPVTCNKCFSKQNKKKYKKKHKPAIQSTKSTTSTKSGDGCGRTVTIFKKNKKKLLNILVKLTDGTKLA